MLRLRSCIAELCRTSVAFEFYPGGKKRKIVKNVPTIGWKPQNYESRVASVRIRCLNTIRQLRAHDYPVELYSEKHERHYKAVVFSKAYNAKDVDLAERLKQRGVRIVFDLCDNHFLLSGERVQRLRKMFELADVWVVSSQPMADVVRANLNADKPLWIIEDAVEENLKGSPANLFGWIKARIQLSRLRVFLHGKAGRGAVHLVWFGNHKASYGDSGLVHVAKLRPLLDRFLALRPVTLTVISNSREAFEKVFADWKIPVHYVDWSPHSFFAALKLHDVAVIPIEVNEFTEVKTNNRIALSLNLGLGVVADSIPSYRVFAQCSFLDDWERGLSEYILKPELISQHSSCARELIGERFSGPVIANRWKELFESL